MPVPIFDNSPSDEPPRPLGLKLLMIGLSALFAAVIAMLFVPNAGDSSVLRLIFALTLAMTASGIFSLVAARTAPRKGKRGLEGLDLYSVIDRLVDDLDDDEAAYLQRRLDQREAKTKDDLTLTVDDVLDQRAQKRDSR